MNKVAVITGASGGIGEHLAYQFAAMGEDLLLVARSGGKLEQIAAKIGAKGAVKVFTLTLDLSMPDAAETLVTYLKENDLSVKHMVNNVGFGLNGAMRDLNLAEQVNMVDLNVRLLTDLSIRFLDEIEANDGGVLNVASTIAFLPSPYMGVYGASKAYVLSFTESLAEENKGRNVKISAVCPGTTETGFGERAHLDRSILFDYSPLMNPETVAEIGFQGYMRGQVIVITGNTNKVLPFMLRFTPRWLVRVIAAKLLSTDAKK